MLTYPRNPILWSPGLRGSATNIETASSDPTETNGLACAPFSLERNSCPWEQDRGGAYGIHAGQQDIYIYATPPLYLLLALVFLANVVYKYMLTLFPKDLPCLPVACLFE